MLKKVKQNYKWERYLKSKIKNYNNDPFIIYTNIESFYVPETKIIFYVNYTSIKNEL